MDIVLLTSQNSAPLLKKLQDNLFKQHKSIVDIFSSPLVFINNNFAQTSLEEILLKNNQQAPFIGNIHFLEWTNSLTNLLEPYESYLNPKTFVLYWSLFLHHLWKTKDQVDLFIDFTKEDYTPSDFYALGQYYYTLFKEYEIYTPQLIHAWKNQDDQSYIHYPHLKDKLHIHQKLYTDYWTFLSSLLQNLYGSTKRKSFTTPSPQECKKQYHPLRDVHIVLPQMVLYSQLQILQQVLQGKTVYIYMVESDDLKNKLPEFYHKHKTVELVKEYLQELQIPFRQEQFNSAENFIPITHKKNYTYFSFPNKQKEYDSVLSSLVLEMQNNTSLLLNQVSVIVPQTVTDKRYWALSFLPYKDKLPHHIIYQQEKRKDNNYFELLLSFWKLVQDNFSLQSLEECLHQPLIKHRLNIMDYDIESLIDFLKSQGAWGENSSFTKQNTLLYHLNQYYFASILETPDYLREEIEPSLIEFIIELISRIQSLAIFTHTGFLTLKNIEQCEDFLEWIFPSIIWKEMDDPYVRKDILDIVDILDLCKNLLNIHYPIDHKLLYYMVFSMNKDIFKSEDLSFAKRRGLIIGELNNLDVFPLQKIILTGFSEEYQLLSSDLFQTESLIPFLVPQVEEQLKYTLVHKLLELLQETKELEISYTQIDSITQSKLEPHILIQLLGILHKSRVLPSIKYSSLEDIVLLDTKGETQFKKSVPHIAEISMHTLFKFLEYPLQTTLEKQWGKSQFLQREKRWEDLPYFFSLSTKTKKRTLDKQIYQNFYSPQLYSSLEEEINSQGSLGILRQTHYNYEQIEQQQIKIQEFLLQIQPLQTEWGNFYQNVLVGSYKLKNQNAPILILEPPVIDSIQLTGYLSFCYIKQNQDNLLITLPIYQKPNSYPSIKMILNALCIALSLQEKGLVTIKIVYNEIEEQTIQSQEYYYQSEDIFVYFKELLPLLSSQVINPFPFFILKEFYAHKSFFTTWEDNYLNTLAEFIENKEDTMMSKLYKTEYNTDLLIQLQTLYKILLSPILNKARVKE